MISRVELYAGFDLMTCALNIEKTTAVSGVSNVASPGTYKYRDGDCLLTPWEGGVKDDGMEPVVHSLAASRREC